MNDRISGAGVDNYGMLRKETGQGSWRRAFEQVDVKSDIMH